VGSTIIKPNAKRVVVHQVHIELPSQAKAESVQLLDAAGSITTVITHYPSPATCQTPRPPSIMQRKA
jgi:hypothetical protein